MARMHNTEEVAVIEAALQSAFSMFDKSTLEGAAGFAWAGEIYGAVSFDHLAADSQDPEEKRFWELARDVELITLAKLETYLAEVGYKVDDDQRFRRLGSDAAKAFEGGPHHSYCEWVAPQIQAALTDFGLLREKLNGTPLGVEFYDHEAAFVSAWELLGDGFAKASAPFEHHLQQYYLSVQHNLKG